jgi:predicted RNA-binding protein with RPS1 domain
MAYYGTPQGFVHFGSMKHKLLLATLEHGKLSQELAEKVLNKNQSNAAISKSIRELYLHGFLFNGGKERNSKGRLVNTWALDPKDVFYEGRKWTSAERAKRSREARKLKVASIFEFRGRIEL